MRDRTAAETALPILCASRPMRRPITPRRFPAAKSLCSAARWRRAPRTLQDISGAGAVDSTSNISLPESGFNAQTGQYVDNYIKVDSRSHAGGSLAFGPDGALYVSIGDGTSFDTTDPRTVSVQNINSLSGKILRIDPITGLGLPDNPFVEPGDDLSANHSKVYQLGLRNPFSIGFAQDGRLFISNTGWFSWEEIESGYAGANFGWPYFEGGDNGVFYRHRDIRTSPATPRVTFPAPPNFIRRSRMAP